MVLKKNKSKIETKEWSKYYSGSVIRTKTVLAPQQDWRQNRQHMHIQALLATYTLSGNDCPAHEKMYLCLLN